MTITNGMTPKLCADLPADSNRHLWDFVGALCCHNITQKPSRFYFVINIRNIRTSTPAACSKTEICLYVFIFLISGLIFAIKINYFHAYLTGVKRENIILILTWLWCDRVDEMYWIYNTHTKTGRIQICT